MNEKIIKYYQGELSTIESLNLLRRAYSDKELKQQFIQMQHLLSVINLSPHENDKQEASDNYAQFLLKHKRTKVRKLALKALGYAAILILMIGATWMTADYYFTKINVEEEALTSLYVPAGQRLNLTLPDGTSVWLNAQTTITYPSAFSRNERRVSIEGEAYFNVTKDTKKPFIVSVGNVDAKVLGTTFNVFNYPTEQQRRISLIEGSLRVYNPQSKSGGTILKPNEEITFENDRLSIDKISDYNYFLWKDGLYSFENESFENIIHRLELYYNVDIEIKDSEMLHWKYTAKFRQQDGINEILRLMQRIQRFKMSKDEENNRIIISN